MTRAESALLALVARRRWLFALAILLAAAATPGLLRLRSDNSPAVFAPRGTPEAHRYAQFVARFGERQAERFIVSGPRLWTPRGMAALAQLTAAARALPGVASAGALTDLAGTAAPETWSDDEVASLRAAASAEPLARGLGWISPDGAAASVLVELAPVSLAEAAARDAALERLRRAAVGLEQTDLDVELVGWRTISRALDLSAREIATLFFPLLVAFGVVLLAATFRDLGGVLVPIAFVAFSELLTLGAMGWCGVRLNLVLGILPPVLFVIALATAVHLLIRCRALEADGCEALDATLATYREKGRALVWTAIATAIGFAALTTSAVVPVRTLGLWAAVGLGVQLIAAVTLYPALLAATAGRRARLPERALEARFERLGRRGAEASTRRRVAVLLLCAGAVVASGFGFARLRVTSDAVRYFAPEHPARSALERSEALGMGVSALELELDAASAGAFRSPPALATLAALADELRSLPGVLSVASATDLVDRIGAESPWAALATPEELRAQALAVSDDDPALARALAGFLSADGRAARTIVFVRTAGYDEIEPLATRIERAARGRFPDADVSATGALRLVLAFHRSLVATLGGSLALALPALYAVFCFLLRSAWGAAKALVPNLWPVAVLLGGMGWIGLPLDLATVMVASIVLGLAVDDTIHTLAHFRTESGACGAREAICARIERFAPAYLLTGAILAAGFGVCALSDFEPIARFGGLAAVGIVLAVVCDLVLVPALFCGGTKKEAI